MHCFSCYSQGICLLFSCSFLAVCLIFSECYLLFSCYFTGPFHEIFVFCDGMWVWHIPHHWLQLDGSD